jgi:hypothetical protein
MNNFIMNEKNYVEELIDSSVLPEGLTPNVAIGYLTKYYCEQGYTLEDTIQKVCEKMNSFNLDILQYQEYQAAARARRYFNAHSSGKTASLRNYDTVKLYKSEYNKIMMCETDRQKKVLFTLYVLARFTDRYGWVYQTESDIFKLANVSSSIKERCAILGYLIGNGFAKETKKVNDLKIGVELSDGNEDVVLEVSKVDKLGNQIMAHIKDGYKICEVCGKLIKIKGANSKYCEKCAREKELETQRKCMKNLRETKKCE